MNKSKNYEKVRIYYTRKLWTLGMVKNAVIKQWITAEEFEEITGIPYSEV